MTLLERRRAMMGTKSKEKVYVFNFSGNIGGKLLAVKEGQRLAIEWDCPNGNQSGWVLNGGGCTDWNSNQLRYAGETGKKTTNVIATGNVRIGAYNANANFSVRNGTITVTVISP